MYHLEQLVIYFYFFFNKHCSKYFYFFTKIRNCTSCENIYIRKESDSDILFPTETENDLKCCNLTGTSCNMNWNGHISVWFVCVCVWWVEGGKKAILEMLLVQKVNGDILLNVLSADSQKIQSSCMGRERAQHPTLQLYEEDNITVLHCSNYSEFNPHKTQIGSQRRTNASDQLRVLFILLQFS